MRQTKIIDQNINPVWNQQFFYFVENKPKEIRFKVMDYDENMIDVKDDILGETWYTFTDEFES